MLLSDIFEQLTYGELSQLSIGGMNDGEITPERYTPIIAHINLGLTELYKRFPLRIKDVQIQQYEAITSYILEEDFTVSTGTATIKYILDSNDPFTNNLLRIEQVYDDIKEEYYPLNNVSDSKSLHVTAFNTIRVPTPVSTNTMTVSYRYNHPRIEVAGLDPFTYDVDLPQSLLEPLLYYVASRAYSGVPALDGQNQGLEYLQKFEASIAKITELSLVTNNSRSNQKIWINGWA